MKSLKPLVVPSKENDHHPHLLKREILVGLLAIAITIEGLVLSNGLAFFRDSQNLASVLPGVVASLTNDARTADKLPELKESAVLAKGAQMKAEDMARRGYFSHNDPDGVPPWKWFKEAGYAYEYAGENLAVNFNDSDEVVDAWLDSPTHRANILKGNFTEIGIGMATGTYKGAETIFVVQFFGKPAAGQGVVGGANGAGVASNDLLLSGEVLGTSTMSVAERFLASPMTGAKYAFFSLAGLLVLVLLVGLIFGKRLPRFMPTISALVLIALLMGLVLLNKEYFLGEVEVDTEAAETSG